MTYKKRAKGSWNAGKAYKKESNRAERQYEKKELDKELEIEEFKDVYREKHIPSKKKVI